MGFAVNYRSVNPVSPAEADIIARATEAAIQGRTWLSCEPVHFLVEPSGHLWGFSKPNFMPHPDDAASAASEGLPDGTLRDLVEILCKLSIEYGVEWEISHDDAPGPIGFIRGGVADEQMLEIIESLADLGDVLSALENEELG
jgi:hypothetical protein